MHFDAFRWGPAVRRTGSMSPDRHDPAGRPTSLCSNAALRRVFGRELLCGAATVRARKVQARLLYDSMAPCYGHRRGEAGE